MAQHGRTLIWLSQHRVIKAEPLSGMECAPLGKDEAPSRPRRRGRRADLIFTASGRGAPKLTAEWCQNSAGGSSSKASASVGLGGAKAASINGGAHHGDVMEPLTSMSRCHTCLSATLVTWSRDE